MPPTFLIICILSSGTFPGNGNPNPLSVQTYNYRIPKNPTQASTTTCLPQGPIGLALNGVPMFNPYSIQCCDTGNLIKTSKKNLIKTAFLCLLYCTLN